MQSSVLYGVAPSLSIPAPAHLSTMYEVLRTAHTVVVHVQFLGRYLHSPPLGCLCERDTSCPIANIMIDDQEKLKLKKASKRSKSCPTIEQEKLVRYTSTHICCSDLESILHTHTPILERKAELDSGPHLESDLRREMLRSVPGKTKDTEA